MESDHEVIHESLVRWGAGIDRLLKSLPLGGDAMRFALDAHLTDADHLGGLIERHLDDEEDVVISQPAASWRRRSDLTAFPKRLLSGNLGISVCNGQRTVRFRRVRQRKPTSHGTAAFPKKDLFRKGAYGQLASEVSSQSTTLAPSHCRKGGNIRDVRNLGHARHSRAARVSGPSEGAQ